MKPKIIAHYLPQFHDVAENNKRRWEWFTEWTNVKKSKPLFKGHNQPRIPLWWKYYNILDPDVRKRQWDIAKQYGIDWFCYYHYWFKWWKKLLEKPTELLLQDGYPDIPFCFSRGNGSWARTREWQPEQILMLQEYGNEKEREDHFNYLLPFFQSPRYMREDNKPIFLIHYSKHMKDIIDQMIAKRNTLAQQNNIDGIHIVEVISSAQNEPYAKLSSSVLEFEPLHSIKNVFSLWYIKNIAIHLVNRFFKRIINRWVLINQVSFKSTWNIICNKMPEKKSIYKGKEIFYWWFVWRDNSPRKWKDSLIMNDNKPQTFKKYFNRHYKQAKDRWIKYIFLNAWNERAEWAYLEPDTKYEYQYLEAIKNIVNNHTSNE